MTKNPFGLRPYETSENDIFFWKKRKLRSILSTLQKNKLVLLSGPSGSGKSSLINACDSKTKKGFIGQGGKMVCMQIPTRLFSINNLAYSLASGELVQDGKPKTSDFQNIIKNQF